LSNRSDRDQWLGGPDLSVRVFRVAVMKDFANTFSMAFPFSAVNYPVNMENILAFCDSGIIP